MTEPLIYLPIHHADDAPPGAIVRHKSGGPLMVVTRKRLGMYPPRLVCHWFDNNLTERERVCRVKDLELCVKEDR